MPVQSHTAILPTNRRGAALVEFALTLPVILLLIAALLEISRVQMLKHSADTAAYEAARSGIVVGAVHADVQNAADALLSTAQLKSWSVSIAPEIFTEHTPAVTVQVDIPVAENSWISPFFFSDTVVSSTVTLITERPPAVQLTGIPQLQNGVLGINTLGIGL